MRAVEAVLLGIDAMLAQQGLVTVGPAVSHELDLEDLYLFPCELEWLAERDDIVWVEQLSAYPCGERIGSRVMSTLCKLADQQGAAIALNPWAQKRPNALPQPALERFYRSFGFEFAQDHVMLREARLASSPMARLELVDA